MCNDFFFWRGGEHMKDTLNSFITGQMYSNTKRLTKMVQTTPVELALSHIYARIALLDELNACSVFSSSAK